MKKLAITLILALPVLAVQAQEKYHKAFVEHFNRNTSKYFDLSHEKRDAATDFRYFPGIPSLTEKGTDVMLYRIDPNDPAGAGKGPEIISKEFTHYGSYSARLRIPAAKKVQPNVGAVVGYFTYNMEKEAGLSEIDWEWLIADPELVYIGTWTGTNKNLQRVGRTINLATGTILNTLYRSAADGNINHDLTGKQAQPASVPRIEGYNAAEHFYTYGFDWYPDRLVWWILHPETQEKIILWDYEGSTPQFTGIPVNRTRYRLNFWHTNNWAVDTNPASLEKPLYPYEVEIDWMSYTPFKK